MWTTSCVINTIDTAACVAYLSPFLIGITGSKKDEEKRRRRKRRKRRRRRKRYIWYQESITSIASIVLFLLHNFVVFDNGQVHKQYLACSKLIVCILYLSYRYTI